LWLHFRLLLWCEVAHSFFTLSPQHQLR